MRRGCYSFLWLLWLPSSLRNLVLRVLRLLSLRVLLLETSTPVVPTRREVTFFCKFRCTFQFRMYFGWRGAGSGGADHG